MRSSRGAAEQGHAPDMERPLSSPSKCCDALRVAPPEAREDGEGRALRRRVTLISVDYADASAQSLMTVLRREIALSDGASQGDSLSQRCNAYAPYRACLHPSSLASVFRSM